MIKKGDYIVVDDFGYKCIFKVDFPGLDKTIRRISMRAVCPDNIGKDIFSIVIDTRKILILSDSEAEVIRLLYEE